MVSSGGFDEEDCGDGLLRFLQHEYRDVISQEMTSEEKWHEAKVMIENAIEDLQTLLDQMSRGPTARLSRVMASERAKGGD